MNVTKSILESYGLYESLPDKYKSLSNNEKYMMYYATNRESLNLTIYQERIISDIHLALFSNYSDYKKQSGALDLKIGILSKDNDSRDGLFYLFLKTYCDGNVVDELIRYAKKADEEVDLNVKTDSYNSINSSHDFRRVIGYFCNLRLNVIMLIYDMVDSAIKNRLSENLYGGKLKQVVNLVKYESGILPEIGGNLRYMVVGEKANLNDEQREKLLSAKKLLRSGYKNLDIYTKTGWAFGDKDALWRTNIPDYDAKISNQYMFVHNGNKLYVPESYSQRDVLSLVGSPQKLYEKQYSGKLIDVLDHKELYKYYPHLSIIPIIYYVGDKNKENIYYFSSDERGGYIVLNGSEYEDTMLSILLHETQHAVQNFEGFAKGGNDTLAKFVGSIGAKSVRRIFSTINYISKEFSKTFVTYEDRDELISVLKNYTLKLSENESVRQQLLSILKNNDSFRYSKSTMNFYFIIFLAKEGDMYDSSIASFFMDKYGDKVNKFYDLLNNIQEGYLEMNNIVTNLKSSGVPQTEIPIVMFSFYQNLYGEYESRSVQASRLVISEFKNYFHITTWEKTPNSVYTVINDNLNILEVKDIVAAVERKGDDYVLHFSKSFSCVPFIHELAHIVYDCLVKLGHEDTIVSEFENQLVFGSIEEFFVSKFLSFLKARIYDDGLQSDFSGVVPSSQNTAIDEILENFFRDKEVEDMLNYLKEVLELIPE